MRKLVDREDGVLYSKSALVQNFGAHWRPVLDEMIDIMLLNRGIGLAAPQIGIQKAVAVIQLEPTDTIYELFNPRLIQAEGKSKMVEGCLSLPGITVPKYRFETVEIEYQDMYGQKHRLKARGLLSKAIQHEMDHLNGRLIVHGTNDTDSTEV